MPRVRPTVLPLVLLPAVVGCEPTADADGTGFRTAIDSLGVERITSGGPEVPLTLREVLQVGVLEGDPDYQFTSIRSITVDSTGGFWVVDAHESVRHYDSDGRYTRSVGGRGEGPGESEMYYSATLDGDRVLLLGVPGVRQLFDPDGSLLGSTPPAATSFLSPVGAFDGRWILQQRTFPDDGRDAFRSRMIFLLSEGLEGALDTVQTFDGVMSRVAARRPDGFRSIGRASWFHGNPAFGVDGRGRIHVSDTLGYRIETWDLDGRLRRVLERPVEPRPFDAAWLDDMEGGFEDAQRASRSVVDRDDLAEQVANATPDPLPPHLHVIENILVGPEGELWVERADRHPRPALRAVAHHYGYVRHAWLPGWAAPRVYDVFDPEGRYEGTLRLPEGFEPMAVAGRRVYGVHYDDLDVERVVVHEITGDG